MNSPFVVSGSDENLQTLGSSWHMALSQGVCLEPVGACFELVGPCLGWVWFEACRLQLDSLKKVKNHSQGDITHILFRIVQFTTL